MATHRVVGDRRIDDVLTFQDATVFITYPTPTTWEADIVLEPTRTQYFYRLQRSSGAFTQWTAVQVSRPEKTLVAETAFGALDHWGQMFDTPRIPGEDNSDYKARLLDVFVHRGGSTHGGLVNAIARDLGLDYEDDALIVTRALNPTTGSAFEGVFLGISSTKVHVGTHEFRVVNEERLVSPVTSIVTPAQQIYSSLEVSQLDGTSVNHSYNEHKNEIHIEEHLGGKVVRLSYYYRVEISRMGKTLTQLKADIEAVTTPAGDTLFSVAIASGYETKSAENLSAQEDTLLSSTHLNAAGVEVAGMPIRWTDMRIESVWDPELHEHLRNWSGSLWNTKVDSAYRSLVALSKSTWGTAVADESLWSSHEFPLHGGQHIDTIFDAPLGFWEDPLTGDRYTQWNRSAGSAPAVLYKGLVRGDFQSGIGAGNDLKVVLGLVAATPNTGTAGRDEVKQTSAETIIPTGTLPTEGGVDLP